jgi:hypothetical protein
MNGVATKIGNKLQRLRMQFLNVLDLFITTQQTIGYNGFTKTCFDSHESSSGYVQNLLVLAVLLLTVLEVIGRYEVVAVLTSTLI